MIYKLTALRTSGKAKPARLFLGQGLGSLAIKVLRTIPSAALMALWSPTIAAQEVAGWTVAPAQESCGMTMTYEGKGSTELYYLKMRDGSGMIIVTNANWSPKTTETYKVGVGVNDETWTMEKSPGINIGSRVGVGVYFAPGNDFDEAFRSGSGLDVYLNDDLIDELSLRGTSAAGAALDRCVVKVDRLRSAEERETARYAHLPDDPFASSGGISPGQSIPSAKQASFRSAGFSDADYPSTSIRNEESGTVVVSVTVGTNGQATNCSITKSSGFTALDEKTCELVIQRSRFSSAQTADGEKIEQVISIPITWRLPR